MAIDFTAGAARRDIMPDRAMRNEAINRHLRPDERGSALHTKALAMTCRDQSFVLIALDSIYLETPNATQIRRAVAEAIDVDVQNIVISASHSHSAPIVEPPSGPHPYHDFVCGQTVQAAVEAWQSRRSARMGHDVTYVVGASFNQRVPLSEGGVKFARDFREGLATGRPVDPRLNVLRIDDERGNPIAGWVRFAAHPACVISDAPVSAEYPGYMTETLSQTVLDGAPMLFGYGASGDVNCIPMFGTEDDSARLGRNLARQAADVFARIQTRAPQRFVSGSRIIELPLEAPPAVKTLDKEIVEIRAFIAGLEKDPDLEWVIGFNCKKDWTAAQKQALAEPLAAWAERTKQDIQSGRVFPSSWPSEITALIVDDLGLLFYPGEPFSELGLSVAARSPLTETLLVALSNGANSYVPAAEDHRRGGYEPYHSVRYIKPNRDARPLPYAREAGECLVSNCLALINELCGR